MRSVAAQFKNDMEQSEMFVDLVVATFDLAKHDISKFRSKHPIATGAVAVHGIVRTLGSTLEAYDGAYLSICAQYELAVRTLIEKYIESINAKLPIYSNLPEKIRDWYPLGCSTILLNITRDKYQHLSPQVILKSLASCVKCTLKKPYQLIPDAFSYHDNNLKSGIIADMFNERLGIKDIWPKLGRETILSGYLNTPNPLTTEQVARQKLDGAILQRNNIIHRGKYFYHSGESEIHDTAKYFSALINSLAEVMEKALAAA